MRRRSFPVGLVCLCVASSWLLAHRLDAGGFGYYNNQSSKAMAMAGAFVAQAEDPSAVFYNIGALALIGKKPKLSVGVTGFNLNESLYQGLPPGVGAGTNGAQEEVQNLTPHVYAAAPLGETGKIGLGISTPFVLKTKWSDPDNFGGRYLSLKSQIGTVDLTSGVAYEVAPGLGVGVGVVYRTSDMTLLRRIPSFDPAAGAVVDVASLRMEATLDDGLGWTAGFLYQVTEGFSVGGAYHSPIDIDYDGEARFTQILTGNSGLDGLIAATTPFDQDLAFQSRIEFPETAAFGVAFALTESTVVEIDSSSTTWSSFKSFDLLLPNNPEFDEARPQNFLDSMDYRLGVRLETSSGSVLRFGASMEESPQPDEAVGPFLPDAERFSYSVGYSKDWLDLAFSWIAYENRTTVTNSDDFNGTYNSNAWLLGLTINI